MPSRSRPGEFSVIHNKTGNRYRNFNSGLEVKRFMHEKEMLSVAYSPGGIHTVSSWNKIKN